MSKRILLLIFCLNLLPLYIFAQQKWKPGFVAEAGLLGGSFEPSADLRAQFLLAKNGWQVGAGSGFDFYRFRSVPVYAQGRKYFGSKKNKTFLLATAGYNFPAPTALEKNGSRGGDVWWGMAPPKSYSGGFYGEAGGGYAFLNNKGRGLALSFSYIFKSLTETYTTSTWVGNGQTKPSEEKITYYMNRLALRVGYKF
jgi:hypothetical protein